MKREVVLLLMIVLLIYSINAYASVSPGFYEIDFEPGLKQDFVFKYGFDQGTDVEVYVDGDLAEYVTLDKNRLIGGGSVTATLNFPDEIDIPGMHGIAIGARQLVPESAGFALVGDARGVIKVKVPYPGRYAEISINTNNANAGEPVNINVVVSNLGQEDIAASVLIEIYDISDNFIEKFYLGSIAIETKSSHSLYKELDTSNYKSGDYKVKAILKYDDVEKTADGYFRLGEFLLKLSNYTKQFERNKINRVEIFVESFWNDPINNVYAELKVLNYSNSFITPTISLDPWSVKLLTGFLDTTNIKEDKFLSNITFYYGDSSSSEIVEMEFIESFNYKYLIIIGIIIVIAVFLILIISIIFLLRKKNKKKQRKWRKKT